jgi:molybdate transport system ATP-binding protein
VSLEVDVRVARRGFTLDVSRAIESGRVLALLGPNGAGKSTTIGCVAGVVDYEGSVVLGGRVLDREPTERRRVGILFQDYVLFPHLSVLENAAFGPRSTGVPAAVARATAHGWLERFGVDHLAGSYPRQLSGGQQQRVALARALAAEPEALLLDEPLAALDVEVRGAVRSELRGHLTAFAGPSVVITHSIADVEALADAVAVIEGGRVVQAGAVADVLAHPATPWVRSLVDARA